MRKLKDDLIRYFDVPYEAAAAYEGKRRDMLEHVNKSLSEKPDTMQLIGNNPIEVMEDNHANHARFMTNIFKLNNHELFLQIVIWVYRSYGARGFSYDYFPQVFKAWMSAIKKELDPHLAAPLIEIYQWLADNHENIKTLSEIAPEETYNIDESWERVLESFLSALIKGDHRRCMEISNSHIKSEEDFKEFYTYVLQGAMYKIGKMWEAGEISVAHEHLASAIVSRVMANLYPKFILLENSKGKAVITASPNEFHEIGPRMVADFLEMDGWDVRYLGANVPQEELFKILRDDPPLLLGLSVSMPFNLDKAGLIIDTLRDMEELKDLKIIVGGRIFRDHPTLWKTLKADGWAADGRDAVSAVSKLLEPGR